MSTETEMEMTDASSAPQTPKATARGDEEVTFESLKPLPLPEELLKRTGIPFIPRKRQNPFEFSISPTRSPSLGKKQTLSYTPANEKILQARQLLVEAAGDLVGFPGEQTRVLDLLEVFRHFTERTDFRTTSQILAKQVSNLETTTKKLAAQAKKPTFADVVKGDSGSATSTSTSSTTKTTQQQQQQQQQQQWTTVSRRASKPKEQAEPMPLILVPKDKEKELDQIATRDKINDALKGEDQELAVLAIKKSFRGNIVLNFATEKAR
ncbi:unnamed protein product [Zymoseptoria tritici ST99CH_1A5]|uniref:Uncharacterized protein n=1 Tax=Zymoseptoria tritici ST99CH_1A5 TaxID=1276529 RepID=A0A1Y6M3T7_ZYMTR|nr:unnamed protein product [Zymoseptoria tritici ST99CH_1A5]